MATLRFERWYDHPPSRVWEALTEPELLARWLMPNDFSPRIGHRFTFRTQPAPGFDGVVHCEVLEVDPPRRLAYTWRGGPIDTVVRFSLTCERGGTRLRMDQTGFRGLKAWLVSRMLKAGLRTIYARRLPDVLARLAAGRGFAADGESGGCMTRSQTFLSQFWAWLNGEKR
jgi:uncharacterized protein YndB with AHSA1/START domain